MEKSKKEAIERLVKSARIILKQSKMKHPDFDVTECEVNLSREIVNILDTKKGGKK